ncbi:hypothetical protein FACS189440_05170 [Bacteroidia bacterium]|nr:hypothetical protein FACS189440_05170 [Bacteroidia bacterium]
MIVHFSEAAKATIDHYFDNYIGNQNHNDMVQRAYHLSKIRVCLSHFLALDTYVAENRKFVDIDDICTVEYALEKNNTEVLIKNIYFNKTREQSLFEFIINY